MCLESNTDMLCSKRFFILFTIVFRVNSIPDTCDEDASKVPVGITGQVSTFPWLGIIRVHLQEGNSLRVAVTGSILVKTAYAIAIADDIARIPKDIFKRDSRAMFFPSSHQPWLCRMNDYLLHPEYEHARLNTIALIELEPEVQNGTITVPVLPICWPSNQFSASNELYALGYTDDRLILEKMIHRVQYIVKDRCEEPYKNDELKGFRKLLINSLCGSVADTGECEWDNGMALASNSTGAWMLIGLSIKGPGCAAPTLFIDLYPYLPWIESNTNDQPESYRKSAFGIGFKARKARVMNIPIHEFLRTGRVEPMRDWINEDDDLYRDYDIERLDEGAIIISKFQDKFEKNESDCLARDNILVYMETVKILLGSDDTYGEGSYKVSLMDLTVYDYTCVTVRVESPDRSPVYLWYKTSMEVDEPLDIPDKTPKYFIKKYPLPKEHSNTTERHDKWEVEYLVDHSKPWLYKNNVNIFLQFKFFKEAYLKLQVWGPFQRYPTTTTTTTEDPFGGRPSIGKRNANVSDHYSDVEPFGKLSTKPGRRSYRPNTSTSPATSRPYIPPNKKHDRTRLPRRRTYPRTIRPRTSQQSNPLNSLPDDLENEIQPKNKHNRPQMTSERPSERPEVEVARVLEIGRWWSRANQCAHGGLFFIVILYFFI